MKHVCVCVPTRPSWWRIVTPCCVWPASVQTMKMTPTEESETKQRAAAAQSTIVASRWPGPKRRHPNTEWRTRAAPHLKASETCWASNREEELFSIRSQHHQHHLNSKVKCVKCCVPAGTNPTSGGCTLQSNSTRSFSINHMMPD